MHPVRVILLLFVCAFLLKVCRISAHSPYLLCSGVFTGFCAFLVYGYHSGAKCVKTALQCKIGAYRVLPFFWCLAWCALLSCVPSCRPLCCTDTAQKSTVRICADSADSADSASRSRKKKRNPPLSGSSGGGVPHWVRRSML